MADENTREELAEATAEAREKQEREGEGEAPPGTEPPASSAEGAPGAPTGGGSGGSEELDEETRALVEELREEGWHWSPLVVHSGSVVGGVERYNAARFLGMEDEVPTVTLEEVYEEAGVDFAQVAGPGGELDSGREFFEDYLRGLPEHIRDKYDLSGG